MLDIDVKGAMQIASEGKVTCNYLFVKVPSIDELKARLQARGSETEESLSKRLANAENELKTAADHPEVFNKFIVNDKQDTFIDECVRYLTKELYHHIK